MYTFFILALVFFLLSSSVYLNKKKDSARRVYWGTLVRALMLAYSGIFIRILDAPASL